MRANTFKQDLIISELVITVFPCILILSSIQEMQILR